MCGRGVAMTPDWLADYKQLLGGGLARGLGTGWGALAARVGPLPRIVVVRRE